MTISYVALAFVNTRERAPRCRLETADFSASGPDVEELLRRLHIDSIKREQMVAASSVSFAEGVEGGFLEPAKEEGAFHARVRELLKDDSINEEMRETLTELLRKRPSIDPETHRYRFRSGRDVPIRFLGRITEKRARRLVSFRPKDGQRLPLDPQRPTATVQTAMQAFAPAAKWDFALRRFEMRQVILRVEHTGPCALHIKQYALDAQGQPLPPLADECRLLIRVDGSVDDDPDED